MLKLLLITCCVFLISCGLKSGQNFWDAPPGSSAERNDTLTNEEWQKAMMDSAENKSARMADSVRNAETKKK